MKRIVLPFVLSTLLVTACQRSEVNGIGSYTPDDATPPQLDLIEDATCDIGDWGWVSGAGTIENRTADVATYEVVVAFHEGSVRLGEASSWIRDLPAGGTARYEAARFLGDEAPVLSDCSVITINRWSADTQPTESSALPTPS